MNGLDPGMMQRVQQLIQQNPQLAMLLQKPGLMQKLQAIAQNPNDPMIAQQYASDPDVQQLISILGPAMGMNNNNNGAFGGFGNYGQSMMNQSQGMSQAVTHINSEQHFNDILTKSKKDGNKLVVVDFYANWCGPCRQIAPDFERLANLYKDRAVFIKVDVDRLKRLREQKGVQAMPTFQFYKGMIKLDEMKGANVRKLEDMITRYISPVMNDDQERNSQLNMKPSPYKNFPLHERNRPVYTKAPFKRMKDKLNQLNNKLLEDEKLQENNMNDDKNKQKINNKCSLNSEEMQSLTQIMNMLQDRSAYNSQKFIKKHYDLLDKLLTWPNDKLPPVLDLIRVLSLHPKFAEHCSKNFNLINKILKIGGNGLVHPINGMLTCRIIINLFNRRVTAKVLETNYTVIINALLFNMNVKDKKNTRLAFVRVLLHYSYCFYVISYSKSKISDIYRGEKLRCLHLLIEILSREDDLDIILNILMGIGTLLFRDENVIQFANSLDIKMLFQSYKQKYSKPVKINDNNNNDDKAKADQEAKAKQRTHIVNCCTELVQAIDKPEL